MLRCKPVLVLLLTAICMRGSALKGAEADGSGLLLHYAFDEGQGNTTADLAGNGLNGSVTAAWAASPSGQAVMMDGTSQGIVSVQIPEEKRFGKESWTFMAMLKPAEFQIDDRQNQRRIFAFGIFPQAYLVIDLNGKSGNMMCYFCYKDKDDKTISTGGSSGIPLAKDMWAHVALVCDREHGMIDMYVNGYSSGPATINRNFAGDYVLGGELTLGNGWHNYWGLMDEVKVYRQALGKETIEAEFLRLKEIFGIVESEEAQAARKRDALAKTFTRISEVWAAGHMEEVRGICRELIADNEAPVHFRSYAHLRMAQSFQAENRFPEAEETYRAAAAEPSYPEVHREEARECAAELERMARGLPPRDPQATRTSVSPVTAFAREFFVATTGNDESDGSLQHPFASLARARDAVRSAKQNGVAGAVAVTVLPGEYSVDGTLELGAEDSGTEDAPVVYRAETAGKAVFYGGRRLSGFEPVTDPAILARIPEEARTGVRQCNLNTLGIDDYGALAVRGFGQAPSPPTLELFVNRVPMTLARWPNTGFVGIRKLVSSGSKSTGEPSAFEYISDRHERWLQATDGWLFGYFRFLWADATARIGSIDPVTKILTTAEPYRYGGTGMETRQGIQYYAFNLLEEIDMPGEWYLERTTGMLYLYPPKNLDACTVELGMLSVPMVSIENAVHLRLEGLTFDLARYNGIIAGNCSDCTIAGCTVSRMAGNGIMIHDGLRNKLIGCDIDTIGRRATEVIGGERETLTPGCHLVENCRIHNFGRIDRTYTPAIQLEGVGHRVAHNLMYNCPSSVMRIEGNDHLIEYNEVHSAVQESDDQGAMELFRNATYRGVVFRYNYYHQVGKTGSEAAVHGQAGIRFDDAISGMLVYGNVFWQSANGHFGAIQMNSGRDNLIDNNLFVDCKQGISGGWNPGNSVWKMLRENKEAKGFYMNELYLSRYPLIATMLDEPGINHVWRNVFYCCGTLATRRSNLDLFENVEYEETDPGFLDATDGDFRLKQDSGLFAKVGFRPIPVEEIGLYKSPSRASWPVETTPVTMPEWRTTE